MDALLFTNIIKIDKLLILLALALKIIVIKSFIFIAKQYSLYIQYYRLTTAPLWISQWIRYFDRFPLARIFPVIVYTPITVSKLMIS